MFNKLVQIQDRQRMDALGGYAVTYNGEPANAIIDLDVQVATDGGLQFMNTISISLLKSQVGKGKVGAVVDSPIGRFILEGLITEDHSMVSFYAKKA